MLVALLAVALLAAPLPAGRAPLIAAGAPDPARAALAAVLAQDPGGCPPAELSKAAGVATLERLGRLGGDDVVLARVGSTCLCGATGNCPVYVVRVTPGRPRVLLGTFGSTIELRPAAPLPRLVILSHNNAMLADESTYAYRNGAYEATSNYIVRGDDHARKPAGGVPVRFAANASSAPLHGSVSTGWPDQYVFAANGGQKVLIDGVRTRGVVTVSLSHGNDTPVRLSPGTPYTLPASGTYRLTVASEAERGVSYALTLAIR